MKQLIKIVSSSVFGSTLLLSACTDVNRLGTEEMVPASGGASASDSKKETKETSDVPENPSGGGSPSGVGGSTQSGQGSSSSDMGGASAFGEGDDSSDFSQCELSHAEFDGGHCNYQYECADGTYWNGCENEDGVAICFCGSPHENVSFVIEDSSSEEMCPQLVNFCKGAEVKEVEDETCTTVSQIEEADYCSLSLECESAHSSDVSPSVQSRYNEGASCDKKGDAWECSCNLHLEKGIWLDVEETEQETSACRTALNLCKSAPIVEESPQTCATSNLETEATRCEVDVMCEADASIGETSVTVGEFAVAHCDEIEGIWNCDCTTGGSGPARFQVDAADSTSACEKASDTCGEHLLYDAP